MKIELEVHKVKDKGRYQCMVYVDGEEVGRNTSYSPMTTILSAIVDAFPTPDDDSTLGDMISDG